MKLKNKLSLDYWQRKLYVSKIYQKFFLNEKELKKKIFTSIYKSQHWVQGQNKLSNQYISVSGHGSNLGTDQFYNLKDNLNKILVNYNISSILDMPCGDFLWMNRVISQNNNIKYLGLDIVSDLISENITNYKNTNINFFSSYTSSLRISKCRSFCRDSVCT